MKLVVTVDTEEDCWSDYQRTSTPVSNILCVPKFQSLCDEYAIRPTYLVTYPITQDSEAVRVLSEILSRKACEIGMHCHPWNTPPFEEDISRRNSMLSNLPSELQYKKLETLDRAIQEKFGIKAVSFRAGRWGYDERVAQHIQTLGYKVDSSVTPYVNWEHLHGPDFTNAPLRPYRFDSSDIKSQRTRGSLLEVPTTIGLMGWTNAIGEQAWRTLSKKNVAFLRGPGMLAALGIARKVWLSPEQADGETMIQLIKQMRGQGHTLFNLMCHSSSLKAGLTPFVRTVSDEERFYQRLVAVFEYARSSGIRSVTLSEVISDYE